MALKNTVCTTVDPTQTLKVDPNTGRALIPGQCAGQVIPMEGLEGVGFIVKGKSYSRIEYCQRCGAVYPG